MTAAQQASGKGCPPAGERGFLAAGSAVQAMTMAAGAG